MRVFIIALLAAISYAQTEKEYWARSRKRTYECVTAPDEVERRATFECTLDEKAVLMEYFEKPECEGRSLVFLCDNHGCHVHNQPEHQLEGYRAECILPMDIHDKVPKLDLNHTDLILYEHEVHIGRAKTMVVPDDYCEPEDCQMIENVREANHYKLVKHEEATISIYQTYSSHYHNSHQGPPKHIEVRSIDELLADVKQVTRRARRIRRERRRNLQDGDFVEEPQCEMESGDSETPEECIMDPYRQEMVDFGVCDGKTMSSFGQEMGAAVSRMNPVAHIQAAARSMAKENNWACNVVDIACRSRGLICFLWDWIFAGDGCKNLQDAICDVTGVLCAGLTNGDIVETTLGLLERTKQSMSEQFEKTKKLAMTTTDECAGFDPKLKAQMEAASERVREGYTEDDWGSTSCPDGFTIVDSESECENEAATSRGRPFDRVDCWDYVAFTGCFSNGNKIYFSNCVGPSQKDDITPVCKQTESRRRMFAWAFQNGLFFGHPTEPFWWPGLGISIAAGIDLFIFNAEIAIGCGIGNDWEYDCFFVLDGAMLALEDLFKNPWIGLRASLGVSVDFAFGIWGGGCLQGWGTDHGFTMRKTFLAPVPALLYATAIDLSLNLGFACPDSGLESGGALGLAGMFVKGIVGSPAKNPIFFLFDMLVNGLMRLPEDDDTKQHKCELCTVSFAVGLAWAIPEAKDLGVFAVWPEYEMQYGYCWSFFGGAQPWNGEDATAIAAKEHTDNLDKQNTELQEGLNLSEEECLAQQGECPKGSYQDSSRACVSCYSVVCIRGFWARTCGECPPDKCYSNDCQISKNQCMPQCWKSSEVGEDFRENTFVAHEDITWVECSKLADVAGKDYFTYFGPITKGLCKVLKEGFDEANTRVAEQDVEVYKKDCEWLKFCQNGNVERHLTSRTTECGYDGIDALNQFSFGGGDHSVDECLKACDDRGNLCQYAAHSEGGYCHLFYTCDGDNGGFWKVHEKVCKPNIHGDYSIVNAADGPKRYCSKGYIHIHDEAQCLAACEFFTSSSDTVFETYQKDMCSRIGENPDGNVCVANWMHGNPSTIEMVNEDQFMGQMLSLFAEEYTSSFVCTKGFIFNDNVGCNVVWKSKGWNELFKQRGDFTEEEKRALCYNGGEWYYNYKPTCVARKGDNPFCDSSIYVCTGSGDTFGGWEEDLTLLRSAIDNGGANPSCPRDPESFCTGGVYDMKLTGRTNECDWGGADSLKEFSLGGKEHTPSKCVEACRTRGESCRYAALSSSGFCHLFYTCDGNGGTGWKVYEKYCKNNPGVMTIPAYNIYMKWQLLDAGLSEDEMKKVSRSESEWYYENQPTCVAYGHPDEKNDDTCDFSVFVCAKKHGNRQVFGNRDEQAKALYQAIVLNGGVHPKCPRESYTGRMELIGGVYCSDDGDELKGAEKFAIKIIDNISVIECSRECSGNPECNVIQIDCGPGRCLLLPSCPTPTKSLCGTRAYNVHAVSATRYECYNFENGKDWRWCETAGHPYYYSPTEDLPGCSGCICCKALPSQGGLGPFVMTPSTGKCGDGLELRESECMAIDHKNFGTFKASINKEMPETCGCFLDEGGEDRYFNQYQGDCNNPNASEQMICRESSQCVNRLRRSLSVRGTLTVGCEIRKDVPTKVGPYHYDTCDGMKDRQPALVEMFARPQCKYCLAAKQLLHEKGVCYTWYDTTTKDGYLMLKHRIPDTKTVPEILINGVLIGGSDDLHKLEENGQLNFLLSQSPRQASAKPYVPFDSSALETGHEYCEAKPLLNDKVACMCSTCCHWESNRCYSSIKTGICYDTNCVSPGGTNPNMINPPVNTGFVDPNAGSVGPNPGVVNPNAGLVEPERPAPIAPPPNNGGVEPFIDYEDQMDVWCPRNVPPCPHPCVPDRKRPTCVFGDLEDLCQMATQPCQPPCVTNPAQPGRCMIIDLAESKPSTREGKPAMEPDVLSRILSKTTLWVLLIILGGLFLGLLIGGGIRKLCTRRTGDLHHVDLETLDDAEVERSI